MKKITKKLIIIINIIMMTIMSSLSGMHEYKSLGICKSSENNLQLIAQGSIPGCDHATFKVLCSNEVNKLLETVHIRAYIEDAPVGSAILSERQKAYEDHKYFYLSTLTIQPQQQSQGLGSKLLNLSIFVARQRQAKYIKFEAKPPTNQHENNLRLQKFYEKHGAQITNDRESRRLHARYFSHSLPMVIDLTQS